MTTVLVMIREVHSCLICTMYYFVQYLAGLGTVYDP
jgi:hypothetical protein